MCENLSVFDYFLANSQTCQATINTRVKTQMHHTTYFN
jgi:hypothetical protein